METGEKQPSLSAVQTGMVGRCPRCGQGKLFSGYLTIADQCSECHLDYDFADSADGPAVFIMLLVGFIVVTAAVWVDFTYQPAYWVHALLWIPLGTILPLLMLRPLKGWWVNNQYNQNAREGKYTDL